MDCIETVIFAPIFGAPNVYSLYLWNYIADRTQLIVRTGRFRHSIPTPELISSSSFSPSQLGRRAIRRSPARGDRPLNVVPNCRRNSGNSGTAGPRSCEFHFQLSIRDATAAWNPWLNRFSGALPGSSSICVAARTRTATLIQSIRFITSGSVSGLIRFENSCEDIDWRIPPDVRGGIILPLVYARDNLADL